MNRSVSCREFVDVFLDAWLTEALPRRRQRECAAHVAACTACRDYTAGYRQVVACLLSLADDARDPPRLAD